MKISWTKGDEPFNYEVLLPLTNEKFMNVFKDEIIEQSESPSQLEHIEIKSNLQCVTVTVVFDDVLFVFAFSPEFEKYSCVTYDKADIAFFAICMNISKDDLLE